MRIQYRLLQNVVLNTQRMSLFAFVTRKTIFKRYENTQKNTYKSYCSQVEEAISKYAQFNCIVFRCITLKQFYSKKKKTVAESIKSFVKKKCFCTV